jgi:hypothetical protein
MGTIGLVGLSTGATITGGGAFFGNPYGFGIGSELAVATFAYDKAFDVYILRGSLGVCTFEPPTIYESGITPKFAGFYSNLIGVSGYAYTYSTGAIVSFLNSERAGKLAPPNDALCDESLFPLSLSLITSSVGIFLLDFDFDLSVKIDRFEN